MFILIQLPCLTSLHPLFISLPGAEKMVDDHLGYHHRKPPSKPFWASGKLSLLLAICIWVRWITSQKWWFSHVFFVRLPEGTFYGCFSQRCRFLAMAWAEENTPPITDMIVLSSTCYWITRNCSKGELHFEQSLAMKNPCVWWWKTQLWSTLDAIPFLVGLNPNFSRWNPIFSGPLPVPFFPAAPTKKTSAPAGKARSVARLRQAEPPPGWDRHRTLEQLVTWESTMFGNPHTSTVHLR